MDKKSSAYYQRQFRQRLREQGLVKKEVWILPENAAQLNYIERKLRHSITTALAATEEGIEVMPNSVWTISQLHQALSATSLVQSNAVQVEVIDGVEPSLHVVMREYGDLPIFIAIMGEQIIAEVVLWPASDIADKPKFHEEVLRSHKFFPLSSIGLEILPDGEECYIMYGALSATSKIENVVLELEVLADNVMKATAAFESFLPAIS
ncbi:YjfI family protein [Pseudomonas sp. F1_0610]|uniref:biofilm formation regulator BacA n=1 Tax=Pseudomonas sp. F1_0610 TaxID=3114284 RepID=UPI0039C04F8E